VYDERRLGRVRAWMRVVVRVTVLATLCCCHGFLPWGPWVAVSWEQVPAADNVKMCMQRQKKRTLPPNLATIPSQCYDDAPLRHHGKRRPTPTTTTQTGPRQCAVTDLPYPFALHTSQLADMRLRKILCASLWVSYKLRQAMNRALTPQNRPARPRSGAH
jgi:hypothetical protein